MALMSCKNLYTG